jgi:LacI family transcriptional regulator
VVTIRDVAKAAGVSAVTVSRVINGSAYVNAKTREKVEKAVRELGYLPNIAARSLRSRQTSTFALIVPDITNSFWTTVASRGLRTLRSSAGYSIFLCNTDENLTKQENYIKAVLRQRVDGVIIAPFDIDAKHLAALRHQETPTVIIDRRVEGWEVDTVSSDSVAGAKALVTHLLNLGHQRMPLFSGPPNTSTLRSHSWL